MWPKEAKDVLEDASGRWFCFDIKMDAVVVLEKKNLPTHLAGLMAVDTPTTLAAVLRQLEDSGEARLLVSTQVACRHRRVAQCMKPSTHILSRSEI